MYWSYNCEYLPSLNVDVKNDSFIQTFKIDSFASWEYHTSHISILFHFWHNYDLFQADTLL